MSKTILTLEQEQEIVYKYTVLKISQNQLHKEYNVSTGTIDRALKRNGVEKRSLSETNKSKYDINQSFFNKSYLNADSAYILGLLASDGWVAKDENCVCIELQLSDKQILEDINKILNNERPIKDYVRANGYQNSKLYFYSAQIKNDLKNYDIVPNKTYNQDLNFIKNISEQYQMDFIRGFFDGDGCITEANGSLRWQLDGTSFNTLKTIQAIFKTYGIDLTIIDTTDNTCTIPRYRLYTYGKPTCNHIFQLFYHNKPTLYLQRKYEKFKELLK